MRPGQEMWIKMLKRTRIEIILDADLDYMEELEGEVERLLKKISDLYEGYGVYNVEIKAFGFDEKKIKWERRE